MLQPSFPTTTSLTSSSVRNVTISLALVYLQCSLYSSWHLFCGCTSSISSVCFSDVPSCCHLVKISLQECFIKLPPATYRRVSLVFHLYLALLSSFMLHHSPFLDIIYHLFYRDLKITKDKVSKWPQTVPEKMSYLNSPVKSLIPVPFFLQRKTAITSAPFKSHLYPSNPTVQWRGYLIATGSWVVKTSTDVFFTSQMKWQHLFLQHNEYVKLSYVIIDIKKKLAVNSHLCGLNIYC